MSGENTRDCVHGHLARSCDRCDDAELIKELEDRILLADQLIDVIRNWPESLGWQVDVMIEAYDLSEKK